MRLCQSIAAMIFGFAVSSAYAAPIGQSGTTPARLQRGISTPIAEVPFTQRGYLIVLDGKANGKPAKFILDSAAGTGVFTTKAAKVLKLPSMGQVMIHGAGNQQAPAQVTMVPTIEIGGAVQTNQIGVVMDIPPGAGSDISGVIGYPFLKNYVVQIDYVAKRVRFLKPDQFAPDPAAQMLPMTIRLNIPEISAQIDNLVGKARLDTGFGAALIITSPTVQKNALESKYPKQIDTMLGQGVGGVTKGKMVRIGILHLGDLTVPAVTTGLSADISGAFSDTETVALIGGELLSRFTVTFDYPGNRLFLTKNADFDKQFVYDRAGFSVGLEGDAYKIFSVVPGGPAAHVGLKKNEVIMMLNDTPVTSLGLFGIRKQMRSAPGTKMNVTIRDTNGQTRTVVIVLRDLL